MSHNQCRKTHVDSPPLAPTSPRIPTHLQVVCSEEKRTAQIRTALKTRRIHGGDRQLRAQNKGRTENTYARPHREEPRRQPRAKSSFNVNTQQNSSPAWTQLSLGSARSKELCRIQRQEQPRPSARCRCRCRSHFRGKIASASTARKQTCSLLYPTASEFNKRCNATCRTRQAPPLKLGFQNAKRTDRNVMFPFVRVSRVTTVFLFSSFLSTIFNSHLSRQLRSQDVQTCIFLLPERESRFCSAFRVQWQCVARARPLCAVLLRLRPNRISPADTN